MPPNLGGFFMVRSYYPSECHADYFDFERIEALKPAIEACRSEERFSRNAETDLVCRLLLEKKKELLVFLLDEEQRPPEPRYDRDHPLCRHRLLRRARRRG